MRLFRSCTSCFVSFKPPNIKNLPFYLYSDVNKRLLDLISSTCLVNCRGASMQGISQRCDRKNVCPNSHGIIVLCRWTDCLALVVYWHWLIMTTQMLPWMRLEDWTNILRQCLRDEHGPMQLLICSSDQQLYYNKMVFAWNCHTVHPIHHHWLSMVLRLRKHNIGYTADGFYRSDDTTNSVKALKEQTSSADVTKQSLYFSYTNMDLNQKTTMNQ